MNTDMLSAIHISGILALIGALLYAIGDVLLLAPKVGPIQDATMQVDLKAYPPLQRRAELFAGMAVLPWWRLAWGGLLGVFAAPLTLAGIWQVYQGLSPAGAWLALPPTLLFTYAAVIGPFIHGSFIYLGQNVQALNAVGDDSRQILLDVMTRQQKVMQLSYGVLFICVIIASLWFSAAVAWGQTRFPIWMTAVNPVFATLAWLAIKPILPERVRAYTEGAGFNIAYLVFFMLTTVTLW